MFVQSASLDGVWYWDLEKPDNLWISPEYWECLGIDPTTRKHAPEEFISVVFEEDLPNIIDNLERHYADPSVDYEQIVRFKHINGSTVWVRCRGKATRDENGKAIRMLGAHNDITALKEAELTATNLLDNRDKFFARMSHEIRTPLHGMIGLAETLQQENVNDEIKKKLSTMLDCGNQLQYLLDDLGSVDALFRPRATEKQLAFNLPDNSLDSRMVRSDRVRLTQILSNIISNAIKFTFEGSITLDIKESDIDVNIVVTDTGEGIADVSSVRQAYHQEATKNDLVLQGTGLGLEIVSKLCETLGHQLNIESEVGKGTSVSIKIPKSSSNGLIHSSNTVDGEMELLSNKIESVLIVDDNEINIHIARSMLKGHVNIIDSAENGLEAVDMVVAKNGYDVVLLDLNMPVMNGYDAAIKIKALTLCKAKNRLIALTADVYDETRIRCAKVGMYQHVSKPFSSDLLIRAVIEPSEQMIKMKY